MQQEARLSTGSIYVEGSYLRNNPSWHEADSPWKARQILALLEAHGIRPASVCEVGCGAGEVLNRMAAELGSGVELWGYELSPQAYELCRAKERPNLHFRLADLLDEEGDPCDLLMAIDVFEHVEDYFAFLRRLRPRGRWKVFHIPLDLSVQSVLRGTPITRLRASVGHIHYFTKETALATLRDTGYEIIDWRYTRGTLDLPAHSWKAGLARLPRAWLHALSPDWAARLLGGFSLLVLAK